MYRALVISASLVLLAGCASIFNGKTQTIAVQSVPDGANFTVTNLAGEKVHAGTTPTTLTLNRGAGYFRKEQYTITYEKPGFAKQEVVVTADLSAWYIGNILFGGLIGMIGVDPATGAMYVFPETVSASLEAASAPQSTSAPLTLRVVSLDAIPAEMRSTGRLVTTSK